MNPERPTPFEEYKERLREEISMNMRLLEQRYSLYSQEEADIAKITNLTPKFLDFSDALYEAIPKEERPERVVLGYVPGKYDRDYRTVWERFRNKPQPQRILEPPDIKLYSPKDHQYLAIETISADDEEYEALRQLSIDEPFEDFEKRVTTASDELDQKATIINKTVTPEDFHMSVTDMDSVLTFLQTRYEVAHDVINFTGKVHEMETEWTEARNLLQERMEGTKKGLYGYNSLLEGNLQKLLASVSQGIRADAVRKIKQYEFKSSDFSVIFEYKPMTGVLQVSDDQSLAYGTPNRGLTSDFRIDYTDFIWRFTQALREDLRE